MLQEGLAYESTPNVPAEQPPQEDEPLLVVEECRGHDVQFVSPLCAEI